MQLMSSYLQAEKKKHFKGVMN